MRIQGKKTSKRRNKKSHFFKRPDKRFTEARRARSGPKSDSKIDLDHNPDEADDSDE